MTSRDIFEGSFCLPSVLSEIKGHERTVLEELIRVAATRCTVSTKFVPHMSVYIHRLRRRGVAIATTFPPPKWAKGNIAPGYTLIYEMQHWAEGRAQ